jgi:nucleoside-diphosphate-sugar epimerase
MVERKRYEGLTVAGTQQSGTVFLLGGNGKLGRMMQRIWQPECFRVVPVSRTGQGIADGLCWSPGDDVPDVPNVIAVVALWGVTPGTDGLLQDNVRLAEEAMTFGKRIGAKVVLHCSSGAVYRPCLDPIPETTPPDPQSPYGQSKWDMEQAIKVGATPGSPRQVIMRIGNVAGGDSLFANLRRGGKVTLDRFGDNVGASRSYIAPTDLARSIERLIVTPDAEGVFNIAAPKPTAMADLALASDVAVEWRSAPPAAFPMMWLDTTRLNRLLTLGDDTSHGAYLVDSAHKAGAWK